MTKYLTTSKSITGVSSIAGTVETVRYVGTSSKLTAPSVVVRTFIHICYVYRVIYITSSTYL